MKLTLEPPDSHHLTAAVGWMELGNSAEAILELDLISEEHRRSPEVLELRWLVLAERKDWASALKVAAELIDASPERPAGWLHRAYAARRAPGGSIQAAWEVLRPAADKFPREELIPYNLACYACQMLRLDEARAWLRQALATGDRERCRSMALQDEDLRPLWQEIQNM
jgi:tetratricopeptide (TPR) repeat protein